MDREEPVMGQKPSRYVATLRDKVAGTPRRKVASRRSLRLDRPTAVTAPSDLHLPATPVEEDATKKPAVEAETEGPMDEIAKLEALTEEEDHEVHIDPVQPANGPLSEDVEEALSSPMSDHFVEEDVSQNHRPDMLLVEELHHDEPDAVALGDPPQETKQHGEADENTSIPIMACELDEHGHEAVTVAEGPPATNQQGEADGNPSIPVITWSTGPSTPTRAHCATPVERPTPVQDRAVPEELPQDTIIGEREDTPIGKPCVEGVEATIQRTLSDVEKSTSPNQSPTDRTTRQRLREETEINIPNELEGNGQELRRSSRRLSEKNKRAAIDDEPAEIPSTPTKSLRSENEDIAEGPADTVAPNEGEATRKSDIYHEEHVRHRHSDMGEQEKLFEMHNGTSESKVFKFARIEQATEPNTDDETPASPSTDINESKPEMLPPVSEVQSSPRKSARSGTRFSDDTSMLKDFLSRAQARKQAKDSTVASGPPAAATPPRRSPRKALANLDSNSPSPRKKREITDGASTPPGKVKLGDVQLEGTDETVANASPVRRSTRKRLPGPAKAATGAPSFIPVRRADGTDPVVIQKSAAQELALVTRTNTRRNKGQAKPPAIILKSLRVEEVEEETRGGHALRSCKSVGWDKKLVYYQDGMEAQAEAEVKVEEKRPKARRLRGLGAGNGTPAPKRQRVDVLNANGTPASRSHGRKR